MTDAPVVLATTASEHLGGQTSRVVFTGTLPANGEVELINATLGFEEYLTGEVIEAGVLNLNQGTPSRRPQLSR